MPGKRPRPIRRTTSVSQLSSRIDPNAHSEEIPAPPAPSAFAFQRVAHSNNQSPDLTSFAIEGLAASAATRQEPRPGPSETCPVNAPDDETMGANADESSGDCETVLNGSSMMWAEDSDALNMAIDSVNDSGSVSSRERSARQLQSGHAQSTALSGSSLIHTRSEPSEVIRPVDFLDICFYCKRRLRLGRDIFMYRGDRAFCSIECRYHQMAADERKEKCVVSAARKGSISSAVTSSTSKQMGPTETAAAA